MLSVFPSLVTAPAKFHPTTGQPAAELVLFCHLLKYQWISGFGPNPKSGQHQSNFWFKNRSNTKRWPSCGSFCPKPKHQDWDQVLNSRIKSSRSPWTNFWDCDTFCPSCSNTATFSISDFIAWTHFCTWASHYYIQYFSQMALHISLLLLSVFLYLRFYDLGTLCKLRSHFINILLRRAAPAFDGSYFYYAILTFVCNSLSSCVSHIVLFYCTYFLPEHTPLHVERKDDLENGICETVTGS